MFGSIPIWKAVIEPTGPVSCEVFSLQSAAYVARKMVGSGQKVIALTDGELTIEGDELRALLKDPNAIHMFNSKLYDSSMTYTLGTGLRV